MKKVYKSQAAKAAIRRVIDARTSRSQALAEVKAAEGELFAMIGGKDGDCDAISVAGVGTVMVRSQAAPKKASVLDADLLVELLTARYGAVAAGELVAAATVTKTTQAAPRWDQGPDAPALMDEAVSTGTAAAHAAA